MKKLYISLPLLALLGSCSSPQLVVNVQDVHGSPIESFPMKVKFGEGINRTVFGLPIPLAEKPQVVIEQDDGSYKVTTGSDGSVVMNYQFSERQPNQIALLLGAEALPDRKLDLTPLKTLPKGSKITVTIPNP